MTIGCIGTDHTRASLALRERLAVTADHLDTLLDALRAEPFLAEAAVLSTCNRTEIYVAAPDAPAALERATQHLLAVTGVPAGRVAGVLEPRLHVEAARHLCAVAAGLRSLAVGETQILTQVREAFEYAAARGAAGPELQALARVAVLCGKRVRAQTTLGSADTSVSALAVQLAQRRLSGLRGRTALLLGAGRINEVSAQLLREAEVGTLIIVSRTREAAARLAALCGGRAGAMEDLPTLLAQADLAIAATRAPQGERAPDSTAAAWAIVDESVQRYVVEARTRRAVPLIAALRAHVDRQKEAELARTLADLEHLAPADREAVALLAHRLVNRMFHHLATRLKLAATEPDAEAYLAALAFLFEGTGTEYRTVTAPEVELGHDDARQSSAGPFDARGTGS